MSQEIGRTNEETVAERYRKQGYQVLNVNMKGFPDLVVLKGKEIQFFVEVKGGNHEVHSFQRDTHEELKKMGFRVEIERV